MAILCDNTDVHIICQEESSPTRANTQKQAPDKRSEIDQDIDKTGAEPDGKGTEDKEERSSEIGGADGVSNDENDGDFIPGPEGLDEDEENYSCNLLILQPDTSLLTSL